jgi:hypothetical protein
MIMRMMQSEIDSPCSRTFCSRFHVSASIGSRQSPFGRRCPLSSKGNSAAIRARHSSVISISGIALGRIRRGGCWPRAAIAGPRKISQLNRSNLFEVPHYGDFRNGSQPAVDDVGANVRSATDKRTSAAFPASSPWGHFRTHAAQHRACTIRSFSCGPPAPSKFSSRYLLGS